MITKREAAIISAYTGILMGDFNEVHKYIEEVAERPVLTHEIPFIIDCYKESIKIDFVALEVQK